VKIPAAVAANAERLEQLDQLVARLTRAEYGRVDVRLSASSVGAHVRHVLEHYRLFLAGLSEGRVDYDARERDTAVEHEPDAARAEIAALLVALQPLARAPAEAPLVIRQQAGRQPGPGDEAESRVSRELLFLHGHTVHHQALVALLLRAQGVAVPAQFGVAPSTLTWLERTAPVTAAQGNGQRG